VLKDVDSKQRAVAEMENLDSTTMELKKPMKFACFFLVMDYWLVVYLPL
jgi:hypothetical protein